MAYIFIKNKKYHLWDFVIIPFKVSPFITGINLANRILGAIIPSLQVLATASFVDTAISIFNKKAEYGSIFQPLAMLILLILYNNVIGTLMSFFNLKYEIKMMEVLRSEVVEKRAKLQYRHIENNDTWDLISRACGDPVGRINGGHNHVMSAVGIIIRVFSLLAVIMTQVWWAALVVVGISVPLFFLAIKGGKASYKANKEAEKYNRRAGYLHGVLCGRDNVEERSLFGYSDNLNEKWYDKYEVSRKIKLKVDAKYFIKLKGSSLITVLISILIIGVLLVPLSDGNLTTGMFIGLATATLSLVQMMSWHLSWVARELANSREYLKDLTEFCNLSEQPGALDLPDDSMDAEFESIEFVNVSFKYPDTDKYILKNCSFRLEKNLHYAFVGINGAGKTTITKLLTGMYDNYEGDIFINGKNLRDYRLAQLKRIFSVVYQDFSKYYITMRDNIALGNVLDINSEDRTIDDKICEIISVVGLDSAVEKLPEGVSSYLGKIKESGVDLSGGEWQRVALARALYNPAQVRILDEPTASLDPVAESNIYKMFGIISAGKSTIFITHRLGAAKLADQIIVIDDGCVAESGSHDELMELGGIYAEMFESQRSWYN